MVGTVYDTPERQTPSVAAYPLSSPVVKSKRTPKLEEEQEKQNETMMDPSKLVPAGSLRQHVVITFKERGDVAKVKEEIRKVLEITYK